MPTPSLKIQNNMCPLAHLLVLRIFNGILLKYFICLRLQVVHEGLNEGQKTRTQFSYKSKS